MNHIRKNNWCRVIMKRIDRKLFNAVKHGDYGSIELLLKRGGDPLAEIGANGYFPRNAVDLTCNNRYQYFGHSSPQSTDTLIRQLLYPWSQDSYERFLVKTLLSGPSFGLCNWYVPKLRLKSELCIKLLYVVRNVHTRFELPSKLLVTRETQNIFEPWPTHMSIADIIERFGLLVVQHVRESMTPPNQYYAHIVTTYNVLHAHCLTKPISRIRAPPASKIG